MNQTRDSELPRPGRLKAGAEHCAATHCLRPFDADYGFYLYKNLGNGKLCVFCDDCARHVEINHPTKFALVAL